MVEPAVTARDRRWRTTWPLEAASGAVPVWAAKWCLLDPKLRAIARRRVDSRHSNPGRETHMEQSSVNLVALNPQPLPPDAAINLVALNPQPLPPDARIELVALNPQPLPPEATINLVALNPQPLPPGVRIRLVALNPQPLPPKATIDFIALNPQPLPPNGTLDFVAVAVAVAAWPAD
jgi:hypothetical protein